MPARLYLRAQPRAFFLLTDTHALVFRQPGAEESKASRSVVVAEFLPLDEVDRSGLLPVGMSTVEGVLGVTSVPSDRSPVPEVFLLLLTSSTALSPLIPGSTLRPSRVVSVEFHSLSSSFWDPPNLVPSRGTFDPIDSDDEYGYTPHGNATLSQAQAAGVEDPCAGMKKYLEGGGFYHAAGCKWDISKNLGSPGTNWVAGSGTPLVGFDERFVWNAHLLHPLLTFRDGLGDSQREELDSAGLLLPVIQGFVGSTALAPAPGENKLGALALISRLSCKRAGARFRTRGIDDDGNVANFVETEVILTTGTVCVSYVEVRGSVPLFWQQPSQGIQTLQQRVEITRPPQATQPAFDKHFLDLLDHYDAVHAVNLLGHRDAEAMLSLAYSDRFGALKESLKHGEAGGPAPEALVYTPYDFHSAVRVGGHEAVNADMAGSRDIEDSVEGFGYTAVDTESGEVIQKQAGVFRVNCLDCLDRTNYVQEVLSTIALRRFLASHGSVQLNSPTLWSAHRELWADNGDRLSKTYAGTGALNTSATRTGRKTFAGLLSDATKSVGRAYINNFQDKGKQEAIDMLLGLLAGQRPVVLFDPVSDSVNSALAVRKGEYSSPRKLILYSGTWNVNGKRPNDDLEAWLFPDNTHADIYQIAFQEIVELTPQQIVQPDPAKKKLWETVIMETFVKHEGKGEYIMLRSEQLVGTALMIVVRSSLLPAIRNIEYATKKTGLQGLSGNKGGVGFRFDLYDASVCLMTCHLAAGQANYADRNADYRTISHGLTFLRGKTIDTHDLVVWAADFNYRIDLPNDQVREYATNDELDPLAAADQLSLARDDGEVFVGYQEGALTFRPTYKYDNGTDTYDSSEKQRIPSWTDRVLFKGRGLNLRAYDCAPLRTSDHRPVYAIFDVTVPEVNEAQRAKIAGDLRKQAQTPGGIKVDARVEHAAKNGVRGLVKEFTSVSLDPSPASSKSPSPIPINRPPVSRDSKPQPKSSSSAAHGARFASAVNAAYSRIGQAPPLPPRRNSTPLSSPGATAVPYEPRRRAPPPPADFKKLGLPEEEMTPVATGDYVLVPPAKKPAPPLPARKDSAVSLTPSAASLPVRKLSTSSTTPSVSSGTAPPLPPRPNGDLITLDSPVAGDASNKFPPLAPKPSVAPAAPSTVSAEDKPAAKPKPEVRAKPSAAADAHIKPAVKPKPDILPKPEVKHKPEVKTKPDVMPKPGSLHSPVKTTINLANSDVPVLPDASKPRPAVKPKPEGLHASETSTTETKIKPETRPKPPGLKTDTSANGHA